MQNGIVKSLATVREASLNVYSEMERKVACE